MHEKVVVVDGERYITGGRNLAKSYFGMAKHNYVDRDVYIEGPSAAEAARHFADLWSSPHVADLRVTVSRAEKQRAEKLLDDTLKSLECGGFVALNTGKNWSAGEDDIAAVHFLHDPLVAGDGPRVAAQLVEILAGAKKSIVIESPYLVPSESLLDLLEKKVREGVSVVIVTNSLRSSDGVLAQAGYLKYRGRVIRAGIAVCEYKGPDSLHAKSVIVDGRIALVGSYNVDPRSQNLNSEVMGMAEDEEVARALLAAIDVHIRNSWRVDRQTPPQSDRRAGVSRGKSLWARFARLVMLPFIEKQL